LLRHHNEGTGTGSASSSGEIRASSAGMRQKAAKNAASGTTASIATGSSSAANAATTSTRPAEDTAAPSFASTVGIDDRPRVGDGSGTKIRELEAQLRQAWLSAERAQRLRDHNSISQLEYEEARGKLDLTVAALQGMDDDFADEVDRLKLAIKRKKA